MMNRDETSNYWLDLDDATKETIRWKFYAWTTDYDWNNSPANTAIDFIPLLDHGYVALLDHMGTDIDIVQAARKSFNQESVGFGDKERKLLKYLWKHRHTSPFEMVEFKFSVHAPLPIARQWMRHRTWNYNEVSRRYTDEGVQLYTPDSEWIRAQSEIDRQASIESGLVDSWAAHLGFQSANDVGNERYQEQLSRGVCREQSRLVLPQSMYVDFVAKTDLWNLLHFLTLRLDSHAQWEIQQYAQAIVEMIGNIVPETMEIFNA
jgi:thymidylate synthase (FAD)